MTTNSIKQAKDLLRREMKSRLTKLLDDQKAHQSLEVTQKVLANESYMKSKRVSIFLSMIDEINTQSIVRDILKSEKTCFIPYYHGPEMAMLQLKSWDDYVNLPETKWKIKQPLHKTGRDDALKTGGLDLIFIPGLAFTIDGARLGRGKGYYDKYLQECKNQGYNPVTIGLAFDEQICSDIPVTNEDFVLNGVISPSCSC
ncbi:5-formyltetrahydrofolate cyclo-ligase [Patella vulgata]|uniref:5-formyltetrahydrofolate cyclo-ligase n=1 Tax=Patella vulgata TaxID=6465 RepID=UPI0021804A4F|nr:5-formyltetrahydrofolate cyclo-ligase [Patella vulgata]